MEDVKTLEDLSKWLRAMKRNSHMYGFESADVLEEWASAVERMDYRMQCDFEFALTDLVTKLDVQDTGDLLHDAEAASRWLDNRKFEWIQPEGQERYCLCCEKEGHQTHECWSTSGLNTPAARELSRLCREASRESDLSRDQVSYPRGVFQQLLLGNSPYAFYLFQWVPYQSEARRWRLKLCHDVRTFDGREAYGIWPNGDSCGPFKDSEVEFIRISRKQLGYEWKDPRPVREDEVRSK